MKDKLTRRQQQFLGQFLDIYQEMDQPVHYVTVAERLGIGKVTTYEMLRLLEERGLVRAEYNQSADQPGPGRPTVLFYPTQRARQLIGQLAGANSGLEDWQIVKDRILQQMREGKAGGYEDLLSDLLNRLPERSSPLVFITELITTILLALATVPEAPETEALMKRLRRIGLPEEVSLSALSGISLAISLFERINRRASTMLLSQIGRFDAMLSQLNEENRRRLSDFTREAVLILCS